MLCQAKKQGSFEVNTVLCSFKTEIFNLWNFTNWTKSTTLMHTLMQLFFSFTIINVCLEEHFVKCAIPQNQKYGPHVGVKFCRNCKLKTVNYSYHSCYFKINVSLSSSWWGSDTKRIFTCTLFNCCIMYLCMMLLTI